MVEKGRNCSPGAIILFSTIFCYLILDFCVKTRTWFSLRDNLLFEIIEVEITRVDCIMSCYIYICRYMYIWLLFSEEYSEKIGCLLCESIRGNTWKIQEAILKSIHKYLTRYVVLDSLFIDHEYIVIYSRTSMARTPMSHLPWLFQTRSWIRWKISSSCRFRSI